MKKSLSTKVWVAIFIVLVVIVGVTIVIKVSSSNNSNSIEPPALIPTTMPELESEPLSLEPSDPTPIPSSKPDIKDFSRLSDYFKNYDFEVSSNINQELYISTYELSGEYDLNGDGINETIQAVLISDYNGNSYVKVNNIITEQYTGNPTGEVKIIDLDSNDDYLELACFDDGPSGDPHYKLFRYNGEELLALGEVDSGTIMDGRGKFISWFSLGVNFKPQFYTSWKELVGNEFIYRDHDVKQYIGEVYELSGSGFFVPLDEAPENYHEYITFEMESMRDFEPTTTKILEIYSASTLFIEFEDGQKGLLYFWIGD